MGAVQFIRSFHLALEAPIREVHLRPDAGKSECIAQRKREALGLISKGGDEDVRAIDIFNISVRYH